MAGTRKIAAILVADIVGYSRLAGADEDRTLSRLRGLRSDLIDPAIAAHHGRIVKRTGDGSLIEFRSVVDAVRCAIEVQSGMVERNTGLPPERRIDPDNVDALIGSARADTIAGVLLFVTDPTEAFFAAEAKLTKALCSVPDHAPGHMYLGVVEMFTKRAAQGIAECEHALEVDRNLANAHSAIGRGKILIGRAEETEAHIAEALRLSPRDTLTYVWMSRVGMAKNHLGSWEQAAAWFRRAIEANRNYPLAFFQLAAALAQLGRLDEAHSAVKAGLALNPAFSISRVRAAWTAMSDDPTYLAQLEPILEGMRKAGAPEQ